MHRGSVYSERTYYKVHSTTVTTATKLQAEWERKPCVNGDTSFLWESETF